jgi:glutamate/aspartate transport system substrate-binding protein
MSKETSALARRLAACSVALVAACVATSGAAQSTDEPPPHALTGVLKWIKEARVVRLGVREAAVPFASINPAGQASGYSVDLCLAIVDDIAASIGVNSLQVEYRRVTPTDRIAQVVDRRIDLECGATTNTAERREQVAFSPPIFIAGTQLLVKRGSPVRSLGDLASRRVGVVRGTTNEAVMRRWAADARRRIDVTVIEDYETALAKVAKGEVAALAADNALLAGYVADPARRGQYSVVGGLLSYEPYGIVFAKGDPALAEVVQNTFVRLATTREIRVIYNKWFLRPLPSGIQLAWPMSPQLARAFEVLGLPPD